MDMAAAHTIAKMGLLEACESISSFVSVKMQYGLGSGISSVKIGVLQIKMIRTLVLSFSS